MKRIEAIIRPTKVGKVCIALENAGHPGHRISRLKAVEYRKAKSINCGEGHTGWTSSPKQEWR